MFLRKLLKEKFLLELTANPPSQHHEIKIRAKEDREEKKEIKERKSVSKEVPIDFNETFITRVDEFLKYKNKRVENEVMDYHKKNSMEEYFLTRFKLMAFDIQVEYFQQCLNEFERSDKYLQSLYDQYKVKLSNAEKNFIEEELKKWLAKRDQELLKKEIGIETEVKRKKELIPEKRLKQLIKVGDLCQSVENSIKKFKEELEKIKIIKADGDEKILNYHNTAVLNRKKSLKKSEEMMRVRNDFSNHCFELESERGNCDELLLVLKGQNTTRKYLLESSEFFNVMVWYNKSDDLNNNSLHYACWLGHIELAKNIMESHEKQKLLINKRGELPFQILIQQNHATTDAFLKLLKPTVDETLLRDLFGRNAFEAAAYSGNVAALKWLVSNVRRHAKQTSLVNLCKQPLIIASGRSNEEVAEYLLDLLLSEKVPFADLQRPLVNAYCNGKSQIVVLFYKKGIILTEDTRSNMIQKINFLFESQYQVCDRALLGLQQKEASLTMDDVALTLM